MNSNNQSIDPPNLLRDPRLSSLQVTPSPISTPLATPSLVNSSLTDSTLFSLRDPALESMLSSETAPVSLPTSNLTQTDLETSTPIVSESVPTPAQIGSDSLSSQIVANLSELQSSQAKSNSPTPPTLDSSTIQVEGQSSSTVNLPTSDNLEHQALEVTTTAEIPTSTSQELSIIPAPISNQSDGPVPVSLTGSVEVICSQPELTAVEQLIVTDTQNEPSSLDLPSVDPAMNGDQEIARSREMSLSLDSTGQPDVAIEDQSDPVTQPTEPSGQVDDHEHNMDTSAVDASAPSVPSNEPVNPDSSSPVTIMKFPLPAKPPSENHTPLFAPSPPQVSQDESPTPPSPQPLLSRLATLKQRVEKNRMDGEAWLELIADAEKKGDLEKTREVYKSFLSNFPDAAPQWIAYADLELGHGHFPEVEQIFSHCLRSSVSVELWAFYLNYIRRVNPVEGDKAAASRTIIISAYEFSLNHIGIDRESGSIWIDYISILKAGEASGTWQEQQKMDSLRKVYQRAVCIPLNNIEQLWKDYDAFENQMSKMTAKKFLADKSAQYMAARAALRDMKTLTDNLLRPKVPVKPNWKRIEDHRSLEQWKTYLQWEEKNPLELTDKAALNARIQYAYRQAAMHMRFYCEIWYLFGHHLRKMEKTEEALLTLHSGLTANSTSMVLTYAIVEIQETLKNYSVCTEAFKALIDHYHSEIDEINKTIEKEIAHGIPIIESKTANGVDHEVTHELTEEEQQRARQEEELRTNVTSLYKPKIDELREAAASVWITEMRFARRTEGIKPARAVFTRARKSPYLTRHVFEASAMMEYHWNKEASVATKVFDLGLKSFSEDVEYVLNYLDFLISLNDDSNARALFEKTISKISTEAARPLWHRWAAYEYIYGDSTASHKLDARISENFPDWSIVQRLGDKHNYNGLEDVLGRELGTSVEPIPLRRSPSPVPQHLQGYGFKRAASKEPSHSLTIPSGPAALQRSRQRDRSFSPDFRGKRPRGQRDSISPERRTGGNQAEHGGGGGGGGGPHRRPRDSHEGPKRNRYSSPPRGRETPPHLAPAERENPFAWFPDGLRYLLGILPSASCFDGPRLDVNTVLQVLSEANISITAGSGSGSNGNAGMGSVNPHHHNNNSSRDGFHSNAPIGWGPNRGGGAIGNLQHTRSNSSTRRGRRK
ncbi:hypothetical protein DFH28DRAFT_1084886 [Melampsora americana]|nr:hypothetical protein DFH28DRAFT_1084886 [Melampsora americana]